ncbi:hypothetical protein [Helicobacter turcicus]|uniref:Apolipoprotein A1/A4/E domain n=1 Tax=Helicobacter turcicus TaxID=2867412 RepID=A0ABS7JKY3_9HELI|nr:hypothetical protein [Helicobacter turcicus]MBX7490031.1 hypothetical protein [Helicobacter turcicus]MBX7544890.1 hypothetical protein [Helicobacter turcicus]
MENLLINGIFTLFMLALAFWDYYSYGKQKHRDFKSIIMSTGVLGTFVGIFVGLQDFDVNHIENSVPSLLAGLQTAFYTSILGMALAILLSILQKSKAVKSDFENMLDYFSLQAGKLDKLEKLDALSDVGIALKEVISQNKEKLESQNHYQATQIENLKTLENSFNTTNATLKEAMHHLAKGASKELIAALQEVIKDFNLRITEQFGDNFKELNNAVTQMIVWQNSYKDSIAGLDSSLKNTLKAFDSTKESLELIASRNAEVLEVYNALAHSIEASRIENEKLSALLSGFESMHTNAESALKGVEELSKNLDATHTKSLAYTKESLQEVQEFLEQSAQEYKQNMQNSLEGSLKALEEDSQKQRESLLTLQEAFNAFNSAYITQNKEQLTNLLNSLKEELTTFIESFVESDSKLKHKNLEMISHIQNSIEERLEGVKDSFKASLEVLENAQKESLLLIEEQAKRSDDLLIRHTQDMGSVVEKASYHLQELSEKTQQNLSKNSDTLEQHIVNAVLNFDTLLGKTTKSLEDNFEDSKNTLMELSKEIESQMVVTTKSLNSLLNDTAETLSKSTRSIEESLVQTNTTLSQSFQDTTSSITENLESTTNDIRQSVASLLEQNQTYSQNLNTLLQESVKTFANSLEQLQKDSTQHTQEMQGQMRASFAESYKNALESLSAYLKNTTNAYQNKLQDLSKFGVEQHQALSVNLQNELSKITKGFEANSQKVIQSSAIFAEKLLQTSTNLLDSHTQKIMENYKTLDYNIKTTLQEMATNYLGMLELLTKQSLETPKNVSVELLNTFNALQKNLGEALTQTYLSLENNRKEIDAILKITQTNITTSLSQTTELNNTLCKSLGELDSALSNITLGFRQDYEWFLRRIRELMGARG